MVLSTDKPRPQNRGQRNKCDQIQGFELTFNIAFDGDYTPRILFLRSVIVFFCCVHDNFWDLKEEIQGWDVDEKRIAKLIAFMRTHHVFEQITEITGRTIKS